MQKILKQTVILLAMVIVVAGCDSSTEMDDEAVDFLYAKVENASKYSNVVGVKLMVHDRNINKYVELAHFEWKDGGFTILLPETLDSNYLDALIRGSLWPTRIVDVTPNISISNENAKISDAYFVGVDKDGNAVITFSPIKIDAVFSSDNEVGDGLKDAYTEAIFTFVNSDVTVSGYAEGRGYYHIIEGSGAAGEFRQTTSYSVAWKKGWNVWSFSRTHTREGDVMVITEQWTNNLVSGLKWYGHENNLWRFVQSQ